MTRGFLVTVAVPFGRLAEAGAFLTEMLKEFPHAEANLSATLSSGAPIPVREIVLDDATQPPPDNPPVTTGAEDAPAPAEPSLAEATPPDEVVTGLRVITLAEQKAMQARFRAWADTVGVPVAQAKLAEHGARRWIDLTPAQMYAVTETLP